MKNNIFVKENKCGLDLAKKALAYTPIANFATITLKRGFSVATPLLRAGCVCFQVFWASQYQLDYSLFRPTCCVFFLSELSNWKKNAIKVK